ncbi:hypothetical protein QYF36_014503 [Acer negundo]|nr:hypothetical protein QYF36_014503 [Acer negundo]
MMARKSYAIEELKGMSMRVAKDISGENRARTRATIAKTVLVLSRLCSGCVLTCVASSGLALSPFGRTSFE